MNEQQTELTLESKTRLQKKFESFITKNPTVWILFVKFTKQAIERGHKHLSSDMILHRIRWETSIMTVGEHYKISNDTSPYFARKFHLEFPQYDGFFRTKQISQ